MHRLSLAAVLGSVLLVLLGSVELQAAMDEEIEAARKKGVQFLIDAQLEDGSWEYERHEVGITSLCALALIENGTPIDDPIIQRAHRFVRGELIDVTNTYDVALSILFLSRVGDRENRHPIRELAAQLIAGQNVEGGWGYSCPKVKSGGLTAATRRLNKPEGTGDNSCTQFAVLGLWVASRWGINIDDTMSEVAERFVRIQSKDGGWPYKHDVEEPQGSRNAMTFAGLFCLTVARANQIRSRSSKDDESSKSIRSRTPRTVGREEPEQESGEPGFEDPGSDADTLMEDPVFKQGLEKAGQYAAGIGTGSARYFLWSVERMGVILGLEQFGETDWFAKGASALITTQGENGEWTHGTRGSMHDTAFAILFLRKANLGSDITRLLEGEQREPFQIVTQEKKPRFFRLEDAIKAAQDGDVIRVDGGGPHKLPHLTIDKSLTIQAGFGYEPVMEYSVGFNEDGRRADPEKDEHAQHMIATTAGTLTLEGLRLQMDSPRSARNVSWVAVLVDGGNLRLLNCSITEGNRQGYAAVAVRQAGSVEATNSLLVGGRAAIEVEATGKQDIQIENSILFSDTAVTVKPGDNSAEQVNISLSRCAVQAPNIFVANKVETPIHLESHGCAYSGESLATSWLFLAGNRDGRSFNGNDNIYSIRRWIGSAGQPTPSVNSAESWSKYWGETDAGSSDRTVVFSGKRRTNAFGHEVRPDEFEFPSTSQIYAYRRETGINALYAGPGYGFELFREGFEYRAWKSGDAVATASE